MNQIHLGICGLGTVGQGTTQLLIQNTSLIKNRTGIDIKIAKIASRSQPKADLFKTIPFTHDVLSIANNPKIDIVVELIGGDTIAKDLVILALKNKKHVVTANKALLAEHGNELFSIAKQNQVSIAYEAAVAGGIPIIKVLRESLIGNQIHKITGIINGTSNYILTQMSQNQEAFSKVLLQAKQLGYAESDPTMDIQGIDAAHKLTIMASIAFGCPFYFHRMDIEGIDKIEPIDFNYALELGYCIKHVGIASKKDQQIELRVHPALLPKNNPIANVNGANNAVVINSDAMDELMLTGAGAGSLPTGSSVVADIIDLARCINSPTALPVCHLTQANNQTSHSLVDSDQISCPYYLRIQAHDHPKVLTAISAVLANHEVNVSAITQKATHIQKEFSDVVILTGHVKKSIIIQIVQQIEEADYVQSPITYIRVEMIN